MELNDSNRPESRPVFCPKYNERYEKNTMKIAVNKALYNLQTIAVMHAFRQRWMTP